MDNEDKLSSEFQEPFLALAKDRQNASLSQLLRSPDLQSFAFWNLIRSLEN